MKLNVSRHHMKSLGRKAKVDTIVGTHLTSNLPSASNIKLSHSTKNSIRQ